MPRMHRASKSVTIGCFCYLLLVSHFSLEHRKLLDHPAAPEIQVGFVPLHPDGIRVTVHWCPAEPYTPVGPMGQTITSMQPNKPGYAFPLPGWRHSPSIPGQSIHYPTPVIETRIRSRIGPSTMSGELLNSNWNSHLPEWALFGCCFSLQFIYMSFWA